jgi:succinylarginine dihydrolase
MSLIEVNFDTLVGPTHFFGGHAIGNLASQKNKNKKSNPKKAALEGLEKMKFLFDMGFKQVFFPPSQRPFIPLLKKLGFQGSDREIIESAAKYNSDLYLKTCNSSSMWTANMATVSSSVDTLDGKVHFTAANLITLFHRSIEADFNHILLKKVFHDEHFFVHHLPLFPHLNFADEGAANHTRFSQGYNLFVYGREGFIKKQKKPKKYPARQTKEASQAIARLHLLDESKTIFTQQNPEFIDKGIFHNDLLSTGHENFFLYYEDAFIDTKNVIEQLSYHVNCLEISKSRLSIDDVLSSYIFNSQIISKKKDHMILIAPMECKENPSVYTLIQELIQDSLNPLKEVFFVEVNQSLKNGGGPACLRLRVPLQEKEIHAVNEKFLFSSTIYEQLKTWIHKHYRDTLKVEDLQDPLFINETFEALDELTHIIGIKDLYDLQR